MQIIEIDGARGEGGGQMIRSSLTMSAITQKPFRIFNIRPNRLPRPHLQPQHLMAARAVQMITGGELHHAELGSKEFTFRPNKIKAGEYEFDIGTAGSTLLIAQTIIPILLTTNQNSVVRIIGGTHLPKSPSFDYFQNVFLKAIHRFGAIVECQLLRSGYYPRGGGIIELHITPSHLKGVTSWDDVEEYPQAIIRVANLPLEIAKREQTILSPHINDIKIFEEQTLSAGNIVTIWQAFHGSIALGKPGLLAEIVAQKCLAEFKGPKADVDHYLADQLLIYAALSKGATIYKTTALSNHLLTNNEIISHFINRNIRFEDTTVYIESHD